MFFYGKLYHFFSFLYAEHCTFVKFKFHIEIITIYPYNIKDSLSVFDFPYTFNQVCIKITLFFHFDSSYPGFVLFRIISERYYRDSKNQKNESPWKIPALMFTFPISHQSCFLFFHSFFYKILVLCTNPKYCIRKHLLYAAKWRKTNILL